MTRRWLLLGLLITLSPLLIVSLVADEKAAPTRRNLEIDDLFRLQKVGSPQVSPDGEWVTYTVGTMDLTLTTWCSFLPHSLKHRVGKLSPRFVPVLIPVIESTALGRR